VTSKASGPLGGTAILLAAKLDHYASQLTTKERRILEAMLVMAMDPLDRQSQRLTSVLTPDEARKVAELRRKK
jgi:hypothetical protein